MALEQSAPPRAVQLADYRPPSHLIQRIDLDIVLEPARTRATSRLFVKPEAASAGARPLRLDGVGLTLVSIARDGVALGPSDYERTPEHLTLDIPAEGAVLDIVVEIEPSTNTALEGLYLSGRTLTTQCEAQGFRRITYFLDRPDVLAVYRTRLEADAARFPRLLSNGNCVEWGPLPGGRHYAVWHDPFPKPCYLFALVAGDLARLEDRFQTLSGRSVALHLYVEPGNEARATYALGALKRAMAWDEQTFGLEYDLDVFQIVAVGDFNMGAMENKGLNIFNARYILADPETATDQDYAAIEAVVAHEYFHNWTGNRVTCRDWFQLSLKEGLTVFRDQWFQADMRSAPVKRIVDVRTLRMAQFPEDDGPLAHPVRPSTYREIANFYTATVYEKGAEVIRMVHRLIGDAAFRRGMTLYLTRNDGKAATVEDFIAAMAEVSGRDLKVFMRWYTQAGTPRVSVDWRHEPDTRTLMLTVTQTTPPSPGQPEKEPLHIPLAVGLVGASGKACPVRLAGESDAAARQTRVFDVATAEATFRFDDVEPGTTPSLFRDFSAPVRIVSGLSDEARVHLMTHDTDPFNRWDMAQQFALGLALKALAGDPQPAGIAPLAGAFSRALADPTLEPAFKAALLTLPSERDIAQAVAVIDVDAIYIARDRILRAVAQRLGPALGATYEALASNAPYEPSAREAGRRSLRNALLRLMAATGEPSAIEQAQRQFAHAANMTDAMGALGVLADLNDRARASALEAFYQRWQGNALVIDKWLTLQAQSPVPSALDDVRALLSHPAFTLRNPNRVRALVGAFAHSNQLHFHRADGAGYRLVTDVLRSLDPLNPQTASRLATAFEGWRRHDARRQELMKEALGTIAGFPNLSPNLADLVHRMLGRT